MDNGFSRSLFAVVAGLVMLGSTWLLLGWPWQSAARPQPAASRRWYYHHFGGGHGGWVGRGFAWGSFGGLGDGDDFRGGGPGSGK